MKFLELKDVIKTNELLRRYVDFSKGFFIELEAYSCKKTKEERKNKTVGEPLCFFINALEMAFDNDDFTGYTMEQFVQIQTNKLLSDLKYILFVYSKNEKETSEYINYFNVLLKQTIGISNANIYELTMKQSKENVYVIYNKKMKRVLLVKAQCE